MNGLFIVSRHALVERADQGREGPGFEYLRWRLAELRAEVRDDAEFWGISHRDICLTRAAELAEARGRLQTTDHNRPQLSARTHETETRIAPARTRVGS